MDRWDGDLGLTRAARWRIFRRAALAAALVIVVAGVVLAPGFDEREVQANDPAVWALQTAAGERFGRVNTVVSEVDTVKNVDAPSDLVQTEHALLVFSDNLGMVTQVDVARPSDITAASSHTTVPTPPGTAAVVHTGDIVAYLTETGGVFAGSVAGGSGMSPRAIDPYADVDVAVGEDQPQFWAVAVGVSTTGLVSAYSAQRQTVLVADPATGEVQATDHLPNGPTSDDVQLAWVGDTWVLFEPESGMVWIAGVDYAIATGITTSAQLQVSSSQAEDVLIADEFGAISVRLDGSEHSRVHGSPNVSLGLPANPAPLPGSSAMAAAWLPAGEGPGTMWMSNGTSSQLDYGDETLGERRVPQLRSNGSRLILNEARSGWVWGMPSGALVPSSQAWVPEQGEQAAPEQDEEATHRVDPRPPVAEDDAFGVRPGRQVALPVLLNDHDANQDVLTIEPDSVQGLDADFGTLSLADGDQAVVVNVSPQATGTATFTYVITDGTTDEGLLSQPATVTLTAKSEGLNSEPEWCGVDRCLATWPTPQVAPGGTVAVDVLAGWVDPEGDPLYVQSATTQSNAGVVAASPHGDVVFQHTNASATETGTVPIEVTVADAHGAATTRTLNVSVVGEPELRVEDLAVTVTAGVTTPVDVAHLASGARGPLTVTDAAAAVSDDAVVRVAQGSVGFAFSAEEPGSYLVDYTLADDVTHTRAQVRVTVIAPEEERLTAVPLTAFVRAREDATVDVLSSVNNPGGHVLLLSDLTTEPVAGARLSADVVGHAALRLSGETSDGQPGLLGTASYTVSDGSGRPEATATGELTLMLLPSEVPSTPLAVDDAITVRVGTQADIQVLANDLGAAGTVIALDAGSVTSPPEGGLAFPAHNTIRYLAPDEPGVYEIDYAAYVLGYPMQRDTAKVVVTVLESQTNAPPTPPALTGRVAAGNEVRLPFDGAGTDPDGDAVALEAIEVQPSFGSARISSDGTAIVYGADARFTGQASFQYSVVDARGQSAVGSATVGVLGANRDPRPVTYTDYIQAQVGVDRRVGLDPTANDLDFAGSDLELVSVRPDAQRGTSEYEELDQRIESVDGNRVLLSVGEEPASHSFAYTVRDEAGSTAIGRIVLKSVREPVADVPVITDTVLTGDTREQFATGVDVLTDKVSWGSGDSSDLTLSLWADSADLTVSGSTIAGPLPVTGRLVPFEVTGTNYAGEEVTSYGFLRVPGEQDLRVTLRESFTPPRVREGESVTFDLLRLVALPESARLAIDARGVAAAGGRTDSLCEFVSGTTLRYSAGLGAPYQDTCMVPVRIVGQDSGTLLPVPIAIIAEQPQPTLTGASVELAPGQTHRFDLTGMLSWPPGAMARAVEFEHVYQGEYFNVQRDGTVLTLTAHDTATPGQVEAVTVSLPFEPAAAAVSLALQVGPAPVMLPRGASVVQQCSQSAGTWCDITVLGVDGEVNPLPSTPLELESVSDAHSCSAVSFALAGPTAVRAEWDVNAPGGVCDTTFVVRDAQGRVSAGDRVGTVRLDLHGFPSVPAEVSQTSFGDGSVTLAVTPGSAANSYPALEGFVIYDGDVEVATCETDGQCSEITDLTNGDEREYTARAVNSVGESRTAVSTTAWSYAEPEPLTEVSATPIPNGNDGRLVSIEVTVPDSSTRAIRVSSPTGATREVEVMGEHMTIPSFNVGSNSSQPVTLIPLTGLEIPPLAGGDRAGASTVVQANGVGAPVIVSVDSNVHTDGDRVTFQVRHRLGGDGSHTWVGTRAGDRCENAVRAGANQATLTVAATPNTDNNYVICAYSAVGSTHFGQAESHPVTVAPYVDQDAPTVTRGYRVSSTCSGNDWECANRVVEAPHIAADGSNTYVQYSVGGNWSRSFSLPVGEESEVRARHCVEFDSRDDKCSQNTSVVPAHSSSPAYPIKITVDQCVNGEAPQAQVQAQSEDYTRTWERRDVDGEPTSSNEQMRSARLTVTFSGALGNMNNFRTGWQTCDYTAPDPPPEEPEEPEPTPPPEGPGNPEEPEPTPPPEESDQQEPKPGQQEHGLEQAESLEQAQSPVQPEPPSEQGEQEPTPAAAAHNLDPTIAPKPAPPE